VSAMSASFALPFNFIRTIEIALNPLKQLFLATNLPAAGIYPYKS
jgi:hypothetical protein